MTMSVNTKPLLALEISIVLTLLEVMNVQHARHVMQIELDRHALEQVVLEIVLATKGILETD